MLNGRKHQISLYVIGAMLVGNFVCFGYLPSESRLRALRRTKAGQVEVVAKAAAQSEREPHLKERIAEVEQTVARYEAIVPHERAIGVFLQDIAQMMTDHELTEQVVVPAPEIRSGALQCIPVHMKCKGTLTQLFEFYRHLLLMQRLVRVKKVLLRNDEHLTGDVTMESEVVIFYEMQKEHS